MHVAVLGLVSLRVAIRVCPLIAEVDWGEVGIVTVIVVGLGIWNSFFFFGVIHLGVEGDLTGLALILLLFFFGIT